MMEQTLAIMSRPSPLPGSHTPRAGYPCAGGAVAQVPNPLQALGAGV